MEQKEEFILVTGGLGLIGHHVVNQLEANGEQCVIVDTQTTYNNLIPHDELQYLISERRKKISTEDVYNVDIADQPRMRGIFDRFKPKTVIHLASFPRQKVVNKNPQSGSQTMSEGLLNLLELSAEYNTERFVYISSSMVYGTFEDQVVETAELAPQGQYGIMKLAGEWLVRDYTRKTNGVMEHVIIRPSAVYGPLDVQDRVLSKFMLAAMQGQELNVNGKTELLDFTYVEDAADGIVAASTVPAAANNTYNITKSHSWTLYEAAKLACKIAGNGTIKVNERDLDFPSRGALNIEAARKDLGYNPKIDLEEGFNLYHEWFKNSVYWSEKAVPQPTQ